jgi:ABC-type branched-subunit amino acid transport system permease subunit
MAGRLRAGVLRLLGAHAVALGFVAVSLRNHDTRAVYEELWRGPPAGICWVLAIATAVGIALSAPMFRTRGRIALSLAALVVAATSRYLIFAVR